MSTAAPATRNAIELADVAYRYRGSEAGLTDIELVVPRGTMTAIIGPNGSGKTTLLRILAGLIAPAEGRVQVCGHTPGAAVRGSKPMI